MLLSFSTVFTASSFVSTSRDASMPTFVVVAVVVGGGGGDRTWVSC